MTALRTMVLGDLAAEAARRSLVSISTQAASLQLKLVLQREQVMWSQPPSFCTGALHALLGQSLTHARPSAAEEEACGASYWSWQTKHLRGGGVEGGMAIAIHRSVRGMAIEPR